MPFEIRIDQVLEWLKDKNSPPDLVIAYLEQPDSAGHAGGPYSEYVKSNLTRVDELLENLMDGLIQENLHECVNIILVSDHGMSETKCSQTVNLKEYLDTSNLYVHQGSFSRVSGKYRQEGRKVVKHNGPSDPEILQNLTCKHYNNSRDWYLNAMLKQDLPIRMHYTQHPRIDNVVIDVENGWYVLASDRCFVVKGGHGYDYVDDNMKSIFIGYGSSFKQGYTGEEFSNIEIFNLMNRLLNITPSSNNGTQHSLDHYLYSSPAVNNMTEPVFLKRPIFPTQEERERRRHESSSCNCFNRTTVDDYDKQLNLSESQAELIIKSILPFGEPVYKQKYLRLVQRDYVIGYDENKETPRFVAYSVSKTNKSILDEGYRVKRFDHCLRPDVRKKVSNCKKTDKIALTKLFPPEFSSYPKDTDVRTNAVKMKEQFAETVWMPLMRLIEEYAEKLNSIHVILGPVFDKNRDGLNAESPAEVPTHFYAVFYKGEKDKIISIVIPHKEISDCILKYPLIDYFKKHIVSLIDLELITGLQFFTKFRKVPERHRRFIQLNALWNELEWQDSNYNCELCKTQDKTVKPLLLISIDGLRPDKFETLENLAKFSKCGARVKKMRSVFPSITFPNHYTQVTGLYPQHHGIIDNSMYDRDWGKFFYISSPDAKLPGWWKGDPLWNTVRRNGKNSFTYFWPGSDVNITGSYPTVYRMYDA